MAKTPSVFDKVGADRLADEVASLITRGFLDSRSAAADALLEYREPPRSRRSDRIAALETEIVELQARSDPDALQLWKADMTVAVYARCAALCREAGCICGRLAETDRWYFETMGGRAVYHWGPAVEKIWEINQHAIVCPHALAARIEALALGKEE